MAAGIKRKLVKDEVDDTKLVKATKLTAAVPAESAPVMSEEEEEEEGEEEMKAQLKRIAASNRTPFEKRVWSLLCQIPKGQFSTYGLMSAHLGSSPRAVGNALRRNPFAPEVPCHRVIATGGTLGGFKGYISKDGEGITLDEKRRLLQLEGVLLDGKTKVVGTPWSAFH